jgi:formylglycine-generating enzyme required for sulfatase activity
MKNRTLFYRTLTALTLLALLLPLSPSTSTLAQQKNQHTPIAPEVSVPPDAPITARPMDSTADTVSPSPVTNLVAETGASPGTVELSWIAPGDDATAGTASTYVVRHNTTTITETTWAVSTDVSGEPSPSSAGTVENMTVTGLTPGQTYYFAIKTEDEVPNTSSISNSPRATAQTSPNTVYLPLVVSSSGDMVTIPAGEFQMGCDDTNPNENCYSDEQPLHTVYLDAYAIDTYEVTNAQYAEFLNAEGNQEEGGDTWLDADDIDVRIHESGGVWQVDAGYEDHPVIEVTWYGSRAYCQWQGKRLPTEAEWEKAARGASDTRMYPWGNEDPDCTRLNYHDGTDYCVGDTTPVGSYPSGASPYGALDMAGNVWEWVNDWYASDYYDTSPYSNPQGPDSGTYRVLRGGGWRTLWDRVRVAYRAGYGLPYGSYYGFGFRCVGVAPGP